MACKKVLQAESHWLPNKLFKTDCQTIRKEDSIGISYETTLRIPERTQAL